ncbi:MAG: glycine zipper 2TM domain-containing protein [Candidatus Rokubacteria bacterium]|nr:glycine zipper 2TM domain-containing protein [Candidatus Rokubacteria bacterium]
MLLISFVVGSFAACAVQQEPVVTTPRTYQGAGAGAAVGAAAGALIDKNNRWRGAVIGGALGAVLGGTLTEISTRAAREAAAENRPVAYQSADGWQRVEAYPQGIGPNGCRQVKEQVYQNGQLVREQMREVC